MIPLVFGVTTVTFGLIHLIPGDPIELMMSNARQFTPEEKERIWRISLRRMKCNILSDAIADGT